MKQYVTEQMLTCVKKNGISPQDIQNTQNEYVTFGTVGLSYVRLTSHGSKTKTLNGWRDMSAKEINTALEKTPYESD